MSSWINRNFDIDLWIKLAADNPFKFEIQRQQWLEDTILSAKQEQIPRLRGLQWEISVDLEIAKNKYTKCRLIANRMVHHLTEFKEILEGNLPFINPHPATITHLHPKQNQLV